MMEPKVIFQLILLGFVLSLSGCKSPTGTDVLEPNLRIDFLTGSLSTISARYDITIKNTGQGEAAPSRFRIVFESRDMDAPAQWLLDQGDYAVPALLPGASYTHTYSREGHYTRNYDYTYTIIATADPYGEVAETDESDNRSSCMKWVFGALRYRPSWEGAPVDTDLTIEFSDPVVKGSGSIIIRTAADGSVFETIIVTSSQVTISNRTVVINPIGLLSPSTAYHVEYAATCFDDDRGNSYEGGEWDFMTWAAAGPSR